MNNNIDIDRITQPIIFVIDSTGSNQGYPITIINNMIRNCVDYLEAIDSSSDYAIRIGILKFNTGCEWITKNMLVPPTDIKRLWEDIIPYGYGELDCVLHELNTKLSRQKLLQNQFRICRPLILFITDGAVSSIDEKLLDSIKNLWSNNVCVHSIRLAVCVGDFFNEEVLFKLVGNGGLVVETGKCNHEKVNSFTPLITILLKSLLIKGSIGSELLIPEIKSIFIYDDLFGPQFMEHKIDLLDEPINNDDDSWDEDDWS